MLHQLSPRIDLCPPGMCRVASAAGVGLLALSLWSATLHAQRPIERQPSILLPIGGGLLAGGVGFLGGGLIGVAISGEDSDINDLPTLVLAAFLGEAVLYPIGVHLGNRRHGSLGVDYGVSLGLAGVSFAAFFGDDSGGIFLLAAAGQLIGTIAAERIVGAKNVRLALTDLQNGDTGLGLAVKF